MAGQGRRNGRDQGRQCGEGGPERLLETRTSDFGGLNATSDFVDGTLNVHYWRLMPRAPARLPLSTIALAISGRRRQARERARNSSIIRNSGKGGPSHTLRGHA
ncbi:hypothetical protein FH972_022111 [Carpinus fangiana]|uniref:Uncharacterized protein n=1 Tax=Carpinus fangiana TaxID=176857 RepID=A0A5N6KR99_9ROSI|nr:hypothetical protein FH972_022111 [Carpinus fangiana]